MFAAFKIKSIVLVTALALAVFGVTAAFVPVLATTGEFGLPDQLDIAKANAENAAMACESLLLEARGEPCIAVPDVGFDCTLHDAAIAKAEKMCNEAAVRFGAEEQIAALIKKSQREEFWSQLQDKARETLAIAFKTSLQSFARQVAHDTAVWVASGGKGQKPLFITEGWGAYVKNAGDAALGQFIDGIGSSFGMDLCQPNFQVRLAVKVSLDYTQPRQTRCNFSQIMTNWQSAISSADFALDYKVAMRPGENDISYALIMGDRLVSSVSTAKQDAAKEAEIPGLWKDIKNTAGQILTPGTMIADKMREAAKDSRIGMATFTNTAADVVEEFLNTLVAQLLKNLQTGLFAGSGGNNNNRSGLNLDLSGLSALFNRNSSPIISGVAGAKLVFSHLIESQTKVGSKIDILLKLSTCSDAAKANPGPTDCVMDSVIANSIREMRYVRDLDPSVKARLFAPQINQKASLDTTIPARSIMIMRKYRMLPVGWEIAADIIKNSTDLSPMTLQDVMNCFYGDNPNSCLAPDDRFKGLVDPYWVLKAPDTFCRRIGYTSYNTSAKEQNGGISRSQGCVDEQQCLQEDSKGNCVSFGYCTEERRTWDLGQVCESKFNTCSTFKSRSGLTANWLKNSLDFENCSAQDAGCRSYATNYNYQSKQWNGDYIDREGINVGKPQNYSRFLDSSLIDVSGDPLWRVQENHSLSDNKRLSLGSQCNRDNCGKIEGCYYNENEKYCAMLGAKEDGTVERASCVVPGGGVSCYVDSCYSTDNLLLTKNGGFENQADGPNAGNAELWTDELSYGSSNNRHYRQTGAGLTGAGLKAISANTPTNLITSLPDITIEPDSRYRLKFAIRGTISQGSIIVAMIAGDSPYNEPNFSVPLGGQAFDRNVGSWTQVEMPIVNSGEHATGTIVIITPTGSITDVTLDNFELVKLKSDCSAAGVKLFAFPQELANPTDTTNIYFNRNAETCSASAFGCSQFIRTKAGLGNNLLYNGGFEHGLAGWAAVNKLLAATDVAGAALIEYNSDSYHNYYPLEIEPNSYYAVSYDAAQTSATGVDQASLEFIAVNDIADAGPTINEHLLINEGSCLSDRDASNYPYSYLNNKPDGVAMRRVSCYFRAPADAHYMMFKLFAETAAGQLNVDNVKIEKVSYPDFAATAYSVYDPSSGHNENQIANLKQAPDYLSCYKTAGGAWPANPFQLNEVLATQAPECANFAGVCMPSEVGCEAYKPINGDPEIPGIIDGLDLCPGECSGYQIYQQEKTNFIANATFKQFIADNKAKYCSAAYAGCDEFTNLDELGRGAESLKYFVQFKACQKPADGNPAAYYTWEGSDITGYQLKAFRLKRSNTNDPENGNQGYAPCTNLAYNPDGSNVCQDPTTAVEADQRTVKGICSKDDMPNNSDCRELYDVDGNIHYRLLSKTVTVSDDCHPFRRTQTQATVLAAQTDCTATSGWWKDATKECIYMALPSEGKTCTAAVAGCRAYTGNRGNNVRNVLSTSNFAADTTDNLLWQDRSGGKGDLMISSEATYPGGNSLSNRSIAVDDDNDIIRHQVKLLKNHTYTLSFWAKGNISFNPDHIGFVSNSDDKDSFSAKTLAGENVITPRVLIDTEWRRFDLGPVFITWEPTPDNDFLVFDLPTGAKIYLDNIILKELNNNIFAIENSWFTPVSCDNKLDDGDGKKAIANNTCQDQSTGRCSVGEMLGCTAYKDRANAVWYLRSFNSLCRREAAGCEALLATHNSDSALAETFNEGDDNADVDGNQDYDRIDIPADNLVYLVNDKEFSCSGSDKGCSAFGLPNVDKWDDITGYTTVFLKNNPTRYQTDLCQHNQLWCEEYASNNSLEYFKDPHGKTCDYVDVPGLGQAWYKTGTQEPCAPDSYAARKNGGSPEMTFGTGYEPTSAKVQPLGPYSDVKGGVNNKMNNYEGFAGNCLQTSSGCTEYVDPLPAVYTNILTPKQYGQTTVTLNLSGNTLYNLANVTIAATLPCTVESPFGDSSPMRYLAGGDFCSATLTAVPKPSETVGSFDANSKIAKAGVYYALSGTVDASSCNGNVDFQSGCILLNGRNSIDYNRTSAADRDLDYLVYDARATYALNNPAGDQPRPIPPQAVSDNGDSNLIVKASPNRTCSKWLECTTYQKSGDSTQSYRFDTQDACLNFSICDYRNPDGSCGRYESAGPQNITTTTTAFPNNLTGFSLPNRLSVGSMDQFGGSASVSNGNFESVIGGGRTGEPLGWTMDAPSTDLTNDGWKAYKYAIEGQQQYLKFDSGYLKINSIYAVNSEPIEVPSGIYALDMWINTLDLQPESATARVFITSDLMNLAGPGNLGNISIPKDSGIRYAKIAGETWITSDNLKLAAGLPWTEKTVLIRATAKDTLRIKLMNFDDEATLGAASGGLLDLATAPKYGACYDLQSGILGSPNFLTSCNISKWSLFDNVSLKPALRTTNYSGEPLITANLPASKELISRSCRAYPAQDARSCQYTQNGKFYYGWYGYCLMDDPDNPGQCLQWYPIDQLKGDVVDEYSGGYTDQAPLFYCAEVRKKTVTASLKDGGLDVSDSLLTDLLGNDFGEIAQSINSEIKEGTGKAVAFTLSDPATANLFRYPMIQKFNVNALAFGGGYAFDNIGLGFMFYRGIMEKYYSCFRFNFDNECSHKETRLSLMIDRFLNGYTANHTNRGDPDVTSESDVSRRPARFRFAIVQGLEGVLTKIGAAVGLDAARLFEKHLSSNSVWGGWGDIVIPIVVGVNIGVGLPISSWDSVENNIMGDETGAGAVLASVIQLLQVDSSILADSTVMGAKIVTDEDSKYASKFSDPNSGVIGNILGAVWGVKLGNLAGIAYSNIKIKGEYDAYYCTKVIQTVTASGQNKAWVNRVSQASQFAFKITDKPITGGVGEELYQYCRKDDSTDVGYSMWRYNFFSNPYCLIIPQSVEGIDPNNLGFKLDGYDADYKPFGALVPPQADYQNPYLWDSFVPEKSTDLSRQPLHWEPPTTDSIAPYQPRMGQPVTKDGLRNLFAKSYKTWQWVGSGSSGFYQEMTRENSTNGGVSYYDNWVWNVPTSDCEDLFPGYYNGEYATNGYVRAMTDRDHTNCYIKPKIATIFVNDKEDSSEEIILSPLKPAAKLDFTLRVDRDQLPLTSYLVEWGDGVINNTSVSGVKLRARAAADNPFTLYHMYDYEKVLAAADNCTSGFSAGNCELHYCDTAAKKCFVKVKVTVTDNWRAEGTLTSPFIITVNQE